MQGKGIREKSVQGLHHTLVELYSDNVTSREIYLSKNALHPRTSAGFDPLKTSHGGCSSLRFSCMVQRTLDSPSGSAKTSGFGEATTRDAKLLIIFFRSRGLDLGSGSIEATKNIGHSIRSRSMANKQDGGDSTQQQFRVSLKYAHYITAYKYEPQNY